MSDTLFAEISLLKVVRALNESALATLVRFLCDNRLVALTKEYRTCLLKRNVDLRLNLFAIISDFFQRETFHSDLLFAVLNPESPHNEGFKYVRLFLNFLKSFSNGQNIVVEDYCDVEVTKEKAKIDLLIRDKKTNRAIIVENKINDAGDQPRQLPDYLAHVKHTLGCRCDAIVYLRLNRECTPDRTGWTEEENKEIDAMLIYVTAYNETAGDLLNGWILPARDAANNVDARCILRQYGALITKLGGDVMNKPIMNKFYDVMLQADNFETAQSLKSMLDALILYRVERIVDNFKYGLHPFAKMDNYRGYVACFTDPSWAIQYSLEIIVTEEEYILQFFDKDDREGSKKHAAAILQEMNCLNDFVPVQGLFQKSLDFPRQEAELFGEISAFNKKLSDVLARRSALAPA